MFHPQFLVVDPQSARSRLKSDVVAAGGYAFICGVAPVDLEHESALLADHIEAQMQQVFKNFLQLAEHLKLGREHVVWTTVRLTKAEKFYDRMNAVYAAFFDAAHRPVRSCSGVTYLAREALVEMDFVLYRPNE